MQKKTQKTKTKKICPNTLQVALTQQKTKQSIDDISMFLL